METTIIEVVIPLTLKNTAILERHLEDWTNYIEGDKVVLPVEYSEEIENEIGTTDEYGRQEEFTTVTGFDITFEGGFDIDQPLKDLIFGHC